MLALGSAAASAMGTSWIAASASPRRKPSATLQRRGALAATSAGSSAGDGNGNGKRRAQNEGAKSVTGSPASAWNATTSASTTRRRTTAPMPGDRQPTASMAWRRPTTTCWGSSRSIRSVRTPQRRLRRGSLPQAKSDARKRARRRCAANGNGKRDPEIEADDFVSEQPDGQDGQQKHLVERVGGGRLTCADVRIPERPFARPQSPSQPEIAAPEGQAEVANVEDSRQR